MVSPTEDELITVFVLCAASSAIAIGCLLFWNAYAAKPASVVARRAMSSCLPYIPENATYPSLLRRLYEGFETEEEYERFKIV